MPDSITSDVTHQVIEQILGQYRPCLTESPFAVLRLLVSVALLQHKQLLFEAERFSVLKGLQDIEHNVTEVKVIRNPQCHDKTKAFQDAAGKATHFKVVWTVYLIFAFSCKCVVYFVRSHLGVWRSCS